MAHIFWTADLETGFQDIDEQHQQLVHYINELQAAHDKQDTQQMSITLFDLIASTMNHFSYEEEMLAEAGYHLLEPRKRMHQNFVDKLVEYQMKMMEDENVIEELLTTLDGWLFQHIRVNDKGYVPVVINSGIYEQDEQGNYIRKSGADSALFTNVAFNGWENQSMADAASDEPQTNHTENNDDDAANEDPANNLAEEVAQVQDAPAQTAWERLLAKHEEKLAQEQNQHKDDDDDNKPRGWAATF